jgi:hypothetical protein
VLLSNESDCEGQSSGTILTGGACTPSVNSTLAARWVPDAGGTTASCTPSQPQAIGDVEALDPVTFCCRRSR